MHVTLKSGTQAKENTQRLQEAIDAAGAKGGGQVCVPPGQWLIQTLFMRSGVELHVCAGAVLKADPDINAYQKVELHPQTEEALGLHYNPDRQKYHLIVMDRIQDASITGGGVIDGSGEAFWNPPAEGGYFFQAKEKRVSPMFEIYGCKHTTLRDITIRNSPGWTVHPSCCDHLTIDGITIENHLFGPNTDGLDINGCHYVFISNCRLHCGDDAIILKAMKDARSTEHVQVTNCVIETNCGALALGAETHFDIRNVVFSNCTIINSHRMMAIIMWQQGTVENVSFSNISGNCMSPYGIDRPIHLDIQEHNREDPELGHMRNILFSGIYCRSKGRIIMTAQDGARIENVTLRDVHVDYPDLEDPTETCRHPGSTQMSNGSPEARIQKAAVIADNVDYLTLENVSLQWPETTNTDMAMFALWTRKTTHLRNHSPRLVSSKPNMENGISSDHPSSIKI